MLKYLLIQQTQLNSADKRTFDLSHRAQILLKVIIKFGISDRLKVTGVNTARGCGVAALAHACMVAQSTFVQVGVSQGVLRWNPLCLETKQTRYMRLTRLLTAFYIHLCLRIHVKRDQIATKGQCKSNWGEEGGFGYSEFLWVLLNWLQ